MRDFAATHGFELSTEFADAAADPRVQGVVLATPHSLHVEQIIAVAAAGKPVWCEKPLALTLPDAERAVAACREAEIVLALGNNKRCFPSMTCVAPRCRRRTDRRGAAHRGAFLQRALDRVVAGGWRDDPDKKSPGGGLTGAGLHLIDALVSLGGPVAQVDARLFERKPPPDPRDVIALQIDFRNGGTGQLASVRAGPGLLARARVRHQGLGRGARRDHADDRTERPEPAGPRPFRRSTRSSVLLESFAESHRDGHTVRDTD